MTALAAPARPGSVARLAGAGVVLVLVAAMIAAALRHGAPPMAMGVAGGLGLVSMTLLAIARYDLAVAVGLMLMAVVRIEPAPPDGAFAVIMAVAVATGRFRLSRVPLVAIGLVAAIIAMNLFSMIDAIEPTAAVRFFGITLYLAVFSIWFAGWVDSPRRARIVARTWVIVAVLSALAAIAAFVLPVPGKDILLGDGATRPRALFKDPNVFGPFLVPIAMIVLEQWLNPRVLRLRGVTAIAIVSVLTLGVLFSFSRAAWANYTIALTITLVAAAVRERGGSRAFRALAGLTVIAALVVLIISATGSVGFLNQRAHVQNYDTSRFSAQHFGYELGWSHPLGVGPGQFIFHHPIEPHSTYVRSLAEQGFGGLALWIGLAIATLVLALRNVVVGRDTYGLGSGALLGAWCGLIFNSAVVDTLHWRHLWVVAALIWAGAAMVPQRAVS